MSNILDWTGISTPFRIENGSVAKSKSVLNSKDGRSDHISESINMIISTVLGEWITRDQIGTMFRSVVFNLFTDEFDTYIKYNLIKAVESQDNRVKITEITINRFPKDGLIKVSVKWDINPDIIQNFSNPNDYETTVDVVISDVEGG